MYGNIFELLCGQVFAGHICFLSVIHDDCPLLIMGADKFDRGAGFELADAVILGIGLRTYIQD